MHVEQGQDTQQRDMCCTQEVVPEMGSQRGAKKYEYDGQQRSRKREAQEERDYRRLYWADSKKLANPIVDRNARKEGKLDCSIQ